VLQPDSPSLSQKIVRSVALAAMACGSVAGVAMLCAFAFAGASDIEPVHGVNPVVASVPAVAPPAPIATPQSTSALDEKLEQLDQADAPPVPSRLSAPPIAGITTLPADKDLLAHAHRDALGHYWVTAEDGHEEKLTLDADLQDKLTRLLSSYRTPFGAVVVMEPSTGRVLAMAEHSESGIRGLTTKAVFPAASVFKIVTATALLHAGLTPYSEECFHGGKHRIQKALLEDSRRDRRCLTISDALAKSANGVFAKLTHKNLTADLLLSAAETFHFNHAIDFPVPTETSLAAVPADPLGLAQTGAGFGDVYLSPLHGALLASTVATGGMWHQPLLYEKDVPAKPNVVRVIAADTAEELARMMEKTVEIGTARKIFHQRGFAVRDAAGKTGSLADYKPFRDYSWFVGYAPRVNPKVAVAAVVVNGRWWRIKAPYVAREAIRMALEQAPRVAAR
jgi:peptidoglycan glycosyltransferase